MWWLLQIILQLVDIHELWAQASEAGQAGKASQYSEWDAASCRLNEAIERSVCERSNDIESKVTAAGIVFWNVLSKEKM